MTTNKRPDDELDGEIVDAEISDELLAELFLQCGATSQPDTDGQPAAAGHEAYIIVE